jgi:hypothetical protein
LPTKTNTRGADVAQHVAAAEKAKSKTLDEAIVSEWNETQAGQVISHFLSSSGRINNVYRSFFVSLVMRGRDWL